MERMITVYLIHFTDAYKHARHYIGSAINLSARTELHRAGCGARLLNHVTDAGISWNVEREWQVTNRGFERLLKNRKDSAALCPVCSGPSAYNRGIAPEEKNEMRSKNVSGRKFAQAVGISYPVVLRLLKAQKIRGAKFDEGLNTWLVPSAQIEHVIRQKAELVKRGRPWPSKKEGKHEQSKRTK